MRTRNVNKLSRQVSTMQCFCNVYVLCIIKSNVKHAVPLWNGCFDFVINVLSVIESDFVHVHAILINVYHFECVLFSASKPYFLLWNYFRLKTNTCAETVFVCICLPVLTDRHFFWMTQFGQPTLNPFLALKPFSILKLISVLNLFFILTPISVLNLVLILNAVSILRQTILN